MTALDEDADWEDADGDDADRADADGEDADWAEDPAVVEWVAPPVPDDDELAAIRTIRLAVVAAVLVAVGFVAVGLSRLGDDDAGARADDVPTLGTVEPVSIGPVAGAPVADYVAAQEVALASASGARVAVVSLTAYQPAADADAVLAAVPGVDLLARLVALPGGAPAVVDEPLENWLEGQRAPLQAERDEIAGLLPTIEDPDDPFIPEYQADLANLDAQLAALDPGAALVFGVVVQADADVLRTLAAADGVRVVAPGPDADVAALATYRGLRPEEVDVAGTPETRPVPAPAPAPAATGS